ncbi:MDR family MFS transporter [Streptomyces sp. NPDC004609]|uniref:MDR family MFS transporter n=1 Tax=Streptomyces sp. NPDC004609 TaxID=3364704 RepID=UPI0036C60572
MSVAGPRAAGLSRAVRESVSGLPREFWWLWTSTLVNRLGGFVATFLVMYLTFEKGYSASYAGLVVSLYGLGGVVSSLGGGVMADRLGRRPTLLIAQASTAVSVALLGLVQHPIAIAVVACVVGMATNASRPAVQAMMADIVRPEDRVRAFSLNYWAINLGFAVSAIAAGFIAEYSYLVGFLGEAAMTMACAILVFVKLPESRPERPAAAGKAESDVGLGMVLRDGRFMSVVGLSFLISLIFMQGHTGLPLAMGADGLRPSDFGMVMALNGVLIVVLQIPVTRFIEHRDARRLLIVSSLLVGYGFGLTAFAGSIGMYALSVVVWTVAEIVNAPTQTGLVVRLSPLHGRGRYQGMYTMTWSVATLFAPLIAGAVIDGYGAGWLWAMCALLGTVAGLGYWALLRNLPDAETEAEAEAGAGAGGDGGAGGDAGAGAVEAVEPLPSAGATEPVRSAEAVTSAVTGSVSADGGPPAARTTA